MSLLLIDMLRIDTFFIPREYSNIEKLLSFFRELLAKLEDEYGLSPVIEIVRLTHPELNVDYLSFTLYVEAGCGTELAKDIGVPCNESQSFRLVVARVDAVGETFPVHFYNINDNKVVKIVYREFLNRLKIYSTE